MERLARHRLARTTRVDEAEDAVSRVFLPHRITPDSGKPLDMRLNAVRLGSVTAGYLAYGQTVDMLTHDLTAYHFDLLVTGRSRSMFGRRVVDAEAGEMVPYLPGEPASIVWDAGCAQVCLMVDRQPLERRLSALLGRQVDRIRFETVPQRGLLSVLAPFLQEFEGPGLLRRHPLAASTLEQLLLDGLLLSLRHDLRDEVQRQHHIPPGPVRRAVELLEERPDEPWTTTSLAAAVSVSVRALQAGFRRHAGVAPATYLRNVRLDRVHDVLSAGAPGQTVTDAALSWGFVHLGRFAGAYRERFGEPPSRTLWRSRGHRPVPCAGS
ncbi:Helix-turn-helix domain-containing protein [Lentzea fradiae]|uniref:Helix-turn-helix domain-containing protein n=1 Tax=Lentzea fradiae TaxID=200378 RepID=A0A1G7KDT2_9PSEU|nr:AraC family transcriptional regulator [Lentzea fradiae]SDF35353.1 Helix-turn-helix domain-containing protein [Lentzea fradiae]